MILALSGIAAAALLLREAAKAYCIRRRACRELRQAARALYDEVSVFLSALDSALEGADWQLLTLIAESRGLADAWYEHSATLARLGLEEWELLSEAISADCPRYGLTASNGEVRRPDDLARRRHAFAAGRDVLGSYRRSQWLRSMEFDPGRTKRVPGSGRSHPKQR